MGNNTAWRTEHGAVYFPNPLRQPNAKRKMGKTYRYKRGTEFPVPHGAGWDRFMRDRLGGTPENEENIEHGIETGNGNGRADDEREETTSGHAAQG